MSVPRTLSDLPPAAARFCLSVRRFLRDEELFREGTPHFLVAFSGGADSTALALALRCLGFNLTLAHLDHGLRRESAAEAGRAQDFAVRLGAPCVVERVEVADVAAEQGLGLEEAGRRCRYAFLEKARQACGADWIVTGHHLDDLAEDQLLRLIRGTGWPALGGMVAVDRERRLARPLLGTRRQEITAFLSRIGLDWVEDPSNADLSFTRNRVRHELLPRIRRENPSFERAAAALWRMAREDAAYWESLVQPVLRQARPHPEGGWLLPRSAFLSLPRALRLRVYLGFLRQMPLGQTPSGQMPSGQTPAGDEIPGRGEAGQARSSTLFQLDAACTTSRARKSFQFPGGLTLVSDSEGLRLWP